MGLESKVLWNFFFIVRQRFIFGDGAVLRRSFVQHWAFLG
jgi:hypothetical protein